MSLATTSHELESLVRSRYPIIVLETVEEERARAMLAGTAASLQLPLYEWAVTTGLTNVRGIGEYPGTNDAAGLFRAITEQNLEGIFLLKDFRTYLESPAVGRAMRETAQRFAQSTSTLILTGESIELPKELDHKAVRLELRLPDRSELREIVQTTLRSMKRTMDPKIDLAPGEGKAFLDALAGLTEAQARHLVSWCVIEDGKLDGGDVRRVLDRKRQLLEDGGLLDYYPPEANSWELGGFGRLKEWLERARIGYSAEARKLNLAPPKGILIVGVQGCGKSLAAKWIAREWKLPLLKLEGGRLYDKYVGETEKNLRRAINVAESMAPAVLWIDELEKVFSPSASSEYDGGLSRRIFGSFLTWLQEKQKPVFVVGAANDLFSVPPEMLRKGRFDEIFFVDLPDAAERQAIFAIHLKIRNQNPTAFDLAAAAGASEGFSGAEIEQAVIGSLYRALHQRRTPSTDLLLEELSATVPLSVSRAEDLARLREEARGRFVSVR